MRLDIRSRLRTIKFVLTRKTYAALFGFLFIAYVVTNIIVNQFYQTLPVFLSFRLSFVLPYAVLSILMGVLAALNITLVVFKFRQVTATKSESGVTALGIFGGLLGGACPGCFVGLFPTLAGVFGVTMTLSALPFKGYEIQIPTLLLMLTATYIIANPLTCKIKKEKK